MVAFEEVQKLEPRVANLIYVLLAVIGVVIYFTVPDIRERNIALTALAPSFAITWLLFQAAKMRTVVDDEGVLVEMLIFVKRKIPFADIESATATEYNPLLDYGGWGFRISSKGKAYNMRGNSGVQLVLKNGGRVLIGSDQDQSLESAIQAGMRGR